MVLSSRLILKWNYKSRELKLVCLLDSILVYKQIKIENNQTLVHVLQILQIMSNSLKKELRPKIIEDFSKKYRFLLDTVAALIPESYHKSAPGTWTWGLSFEIIFLNFDANRPSPKALFRILDFYDLRFHFFKLHYFFYFFTRKNFKEN